MGSNPTLSAIKAIQKLLLNSSNIPFNKFFITEANAPFSGLSQLIWVTHVELDFIIKNQRCRYKFLWDFTYKLGGGVFATTSRLQRHRFPLWYVIKDGLLLLSRPLRKAWLKWYAKWSETRLKIMGRCFGVDRYYPARTVQVLFIRCCILEIGELPNSTTLIP